MLTNHERGILGRIRRGRRGIGFIWFCLMALPVVFFSAGLSVDFTRIIVAQREANNLAGAAAIAGAFEFESGQAYLNRGRAEAAAQETWKVGREGGAVNLLVPGAEPVVELAPRTGPPTIVTVTVDYTVSDLVFTSMFTDDNEVNGQVARTASVCVPGVVTNPTRGYCTRPFD